MKNRHFTIVTLTIAILIGWLGQGALGEVSIGPFSDLKVVQRMGGFGEMAVSGQTGAATDQVFVRVVSANDKTQAVVDWTPAKVDEKAKWNCTLSKIPQGGWYVVEAAIGADKSSSVVSTSRFGVGILIVCIGQSNMYRNAIGSISMPQFKPYPSADAPLVSCVSGLEDRPPKWHSAVPGEGRVNFSIMMGSILAERLKIPVGVVHAAWGATSLNEWIYTVEEKKKRPDEFVFNDGKPRTRPVWEQLEEKIKFIGGDAEFFLWHQGEGGYGGAAMKNTDNHTKLYEEGLNTLCARLEKVVKRKDFAFLCCGLGRSAWVKTEDAGKYSATQPVEYKTPNGKDDVRWAEMRFEKANPHGAPGVSTTDIRHDCLHFLPRDRVLWAGRMAQSILYHLKVEKYSGFGPGLDPDSLVVNGKTLELKVKHEGGDKLILPYPDRPVQGFTITDDDFQTEISIEKFEIVQPDKVRITLAREPGANLRISYLNGVPFSDVDLKILASPDRVKIGGSGHERDVDDPPGNILYDNAKVPGRNTRPGLPVKNTLGFIGKPESASLKFGRKLEETLATGRLKDRQDGGILFLGDSITARFGYGEGKETWDKFYEPRKAVNGGLSGEAVSGLLERLTVIKSIRPKVVIVMIGTNGPGGKVEPEKRADALVTGITKVRDTVRDKWPDAFVIMMAIPPRGEYQGAQEQTLAEVNKKLSAMADDKTAFVDLRDKLMLDAEKKYYVEQLDDRIHFRPAFYAAWADVVEPIVQKYVGRIQSPKERP